MAKLLCALAQLAIVVSISSSSPLPVAEKSGTSRAPRQQHQQVGGGFFYNAPGTASEAGVNNYYPGLPLGPYYGGAQPQQQFYGAGAGAGVDGRYPQFVPYFEAQFAAPQQVADEKSAASGSQQVPLLVAGPYFHQVNQQGGATPTQQQLQGFYGQNLLGGAYYYPQQTAQPVYGFGSLSNPQATYFPVASNFLPYTDAGPLTSYLDERKESVTTVLRPEDNRATLPAAFVSVPASSYVGDKPKNKQDDGSAAGAGGDGGADASGGDGGAADAGGSDDGSADSGSSGDSGAGNSLPTTIGSQTCDLTDNDCRLQEVVSQLPSEVQEEAKRWNYAVDYWVSEPAALLYMGSIQLTSSAGDKTAGLYYWLRPDGHLQKVYYTNVGGDLFKAPVVVENFTPGDWSLPAPAPTSTTGEVLPPADVPLIRRYNRFQRQ